MEEEEEEEVEKEEEYEEAPRAPLVEHEFESPSEVKEGL